MCVLISGNHMMCVLLVISGNHMTWSRTVVFGDDNNKAKLHATKRQMCNIQDI